jgi:Tol biopolymer transport system component
MFFWLTQRETRAPLREVPLTSYNGYQGEPALSADGSQFAFVWDGGKKKSPLQLYVSLIGRGTPLGTPLRLTNTPDAEARFPSWSPDGQMIAFVRSSLAKNSGDLIIIPALGGPERRIEEAAVLDRPAWSPDGKWLYFTVLTSPQTIAVFVEPSSGGEKRQLIDPPAGAGDGQPSVSPDGRKLAFVRAFGMNSHDLFVADLRDGNTAGVPRRLARDHGITSSPVFTTDGRDIIYLGGDIFSRGIYRVRASGGSSARMEGISGDYASSLSIALKGHRLAYSRSLQDFNIWRMPLPSGGGSAGAPEKFLSSTRYEVSPAYSPDGRRIAFSSNRGGVRQIWVADADGNPVALTNFAEGVAGSPKWSPDSQAIAFDARLEGLADIYSIKADGGTPKRLTDHPAEDTVPCFSADGRWIYFASTRSGERQLYRMPAKGGEAVQITRKGGAFVPAASPDGKWIYYSKTGGGLWRVPSEGGEESPVPGIPSLYNNHSFSVTGSGIYFAAAPDPVSMKIPLKLYRFADGNTVDLHRFDKRLGLHISVSPDEKWLAYTQLDSSVDDLMLVENFR